MATKKLMSETGQAAYEARMKTAGSKVVRPTAGNGTITLLKKRRPS